jgi:hypothetical protein
MVARLEDGLAALVVERWARGEERDVKNKCRRVQWFLHVPCTLCANEGVGGYPDAMGFQPLAEETDTSTLEATQERTLTATQNMMCTVRIEKEL